MTAHNTLPAAEIESEVMTCGAVSRLSLEKKPAGNMRAGVEIGEQQTASILSPYANEWFSSLPKITKDQVNLSSAFHRLPTTLYESLADVVSRSLRRYTSGSLEETKIRLLDFRDDDFETAALLSDQRPSLATFAVGHGPARIVVELSTDFAVALVDHVLGGDGVPLDSLRSLSEIETAVLEFLFLDVTRELNSLLGRSVVRLESVTNAITPPVGLPEGPRLNVSSPDEKGRGVIVTFEMVAGRVPGYARVYASYASFEELGKAVDGGELRIRNAQHDALWTARTIERFRAITPNVNLSLIIGETDIAVDELADLEVGDAIVIGRPEGYWLPAPLNTDLRVLVGDGEGLVLEGTSTSSEWRANGNIGLILRKVDCRVERNEMELNDMEENLVSEKIFGDDASTLGGLLLTLRVEMASRRARLEDLAAMRVGQILDLGRHPTDPVDLVIDGRRIARGELVEIEGRLGVRLTQVAAK